MGRRRTELPNQLGQAKVEDLQTPVFGQEQIFGLEITMDNALVVSDRKTAGNLQRQVHGFAQRQRSPAEAFSEGLALKQFRNDVWCALICCAQVVDGQNVGMVQCRRGPGLLLEAAQALRIAGEYAW